LFHQRLAQVIVNGAQAPNADPLPKLMEHAHIGPLVAIA
jgi:hypothetical protein